MRIRLISMLIGLVLIGAACLKSFGLEVQPEVQFTWLQNPPITVAVILWEILLGLLMIGGIARPVTWGLAVTTFLGFTIASVHLGLEGQPSCGCFGRLEVNPDKELSSQESR